MARYMVPRYVDVLDALPLTPTEKVEKYRLQERGVTATTWDRDASAEELGEPGRVHAGQLRERHASAPAIRSRRRRPCR